MTQNNVAMRQNTFVLMQNKVAMEQISVASNVKSGGTPPPSRLFLRQPTLLVAPKLLAKAEGGSDICENPLPGREHGRSIASTPQRENWQHGLVMKDHVLNKKLELAGKMIPRPSLLP